MIIFNSNKKIDFSPDGSELNISKDLNAQRRFFLTLEKFLVENGISNRFSLGKVGDHDEFSLICVDDFWVVAYSEKGTTQFKGVFYSFIDAAEFLIHRLLDKDRYKLDFTKIFK